METPTHYDSEEVNRMLRQNGGDTPVIPDNANLMEHLKSKTIEELRTELKTLFEEEESSGKEVDPALVEAYIDAIDALMPDDPAMEQAFDRAWVRFQSDHHPVHDEKTEYRTHRPSWISFSRLLSAAVILAAVMLISAAAFNWPEYLVSWGRDTFQIRPHESGTMVLESPGESGYTSLADAVKDYTDLDVAPKWIPTSFMIDDIRVTHPAHFTTVSALYFDDELSIHIRILCYENESLLPSFSIEKDAEFSREIYTVNGIDHEITENQGHIQVAWKNGLCVCSISGDCSVKDAKTMIDSIYER